VNKILRFAVSTALLSYLAWKTDWPHVAQAFGRLRWEYWLLAALVLVFTQLLSARRWQLLAQAVGIAKDFTQITGYYFIGMFFNLVLPTSVGGDVVRAYYLTPRQGPRLPAFVSVLFDRVNGLIVLLALASIAVVAQMDKLPWWIPAFIWSAIGGMALGMSLLPWLARFGRHGHLRVQQLRAMIQLLRQPKLLIQTTLLSLLIQVANIFLVWLVGLALQLEVPFLYYWVLVPMVSVLTLLPSVAGTGVREMGTVLLLAPLGIDETTAVTLAFLWFAVQVAVSLLGGLAYLSGRFSRIPNLSEDAADDRSVDHHSDQGRTGQYRQAA